MQEKFEMLLNCLKYQDFKSIMHFCRDENQFEEINQNSLKNFLNNTRKAVFSNIS